MMRYNNEQLTDKTACSGVRADLKMCLLESDCCKLVSFTDDSQTEKLKIFLFAFSRRKLLENVSIFMTDQFPANVKF